MAISVIFRPEGYTVAKHREVLEQLAAAGQGNPPGRQHHQGLARGETIEMVVDVWDSPEQLQAFAAHLMPILAQVGVTPPQPEIYDTVSL